MPTPILFILNRLTGITGKPPFLDRAQTRALSPVINYVWITGWEHGVSPTTQGGGLGNTIAGTPTVVSTPVNSGAYSLRMIGDGVTAQSVARNFPNPPQIAVARFYIRYSAYPSSATACINFRITTAATDVLLTVSTAGVISAKVGAGTTVNGPTLSLNTWYLVDIRANITTATWTCDWQIDGVAQTQATEASRPVNDTLTYFRLGTSSTTSTYTVYYDDVAMNTSPSTYPIGAGGTQILLGVSDGASVAGTNTIEDNAGTDIGVTTAWDKVDAIPMSTATTYIQQATIGAGNYAEIVFSDITANRSSIIGAQGILAYTSASTPANSGATLMSKDNFYTNTSIWGTAAVPADMSDGSTASLFYKSEIIANVNTDALVNEIKARVGYSGDVTPNPYWINLAVEVGYTAAVAVISAADVTETATAIDTIDAGLLFADGVTESATATDSPSAIVTMPASATESASATDSPSAVATMPASITETATATDSPSAIATMLASVTETGAAADNPSAIATMPASVTETTTAADSPSAGLLLPATITETGAATDTPSAIATMPASVTETATATDSMSATVTQPASITESASATDEATALLIASASITESVTATDSTSITSVDKYASVTETATATDNVDGLAGYFVAIVESANATDTTSATGGNQVEVTETATATDSASVIVSYSASITESATATDTINALANVYASIIETATVTDTNDAIADYVVSVIETATATDISNGIIGGVSVIETASAASLQWTDIVYAPLALIPHADEYGASPSYHSQPVQPKVIRYDDVNDY